LSLHDRLLAEVSARPRLWRWYCRLRRERPPPGPIHQLLDVFAGECPDVFFVQVGSNDASFGDPVIGFVLGRGWRGILIEPVPYVFERLRTRHGRNPRLQLENVAIAGADGTRTFYYLERLDPPLSPWYDQMGSFSRAHIEKHERFTPGLSRHIRQMEVPCLSLASLLRRSGVQRLDLLHVDAEGYDFEVIQSLDFDTVTPGIIVFEHGHVSRAAREAGLAFLAERGYRVVHEGRDSFALHAQAAARWPVTARLFDALAPDL
jgi:FkbM family methyltransferase